MSADLAEEVALAPELRMAAARYTEEFAAPAAELWRVPGLLTLLANGPRRLTVAAPWGALAAAGPNEDGLLDLARLERPGERDRVTLADAAAGYGPSWAAAALASARAGTRLLIGSQLPDGTGAGSALAAEQAIRLCLGGPPEHQAVPQQAVPQQAVSHQAGAGHERGCGLLSGQLVPCDLAAAGLRLLIVDTRVRGTARPAPAEDSPVAAAADAARAGDFARLGAALTAAHRTTPCDDVQHVAVQAALRAGALGARAVSDGPGRPICALAPTECVPELRAAIGRDLIRAGYRPPRFLTFTPVAGPTRVAAPTVGQSAR